MPNDYEKLPTYPLVPLATPFKDVRGVIQNLVTTGVASVVLIDSKKGTERANHWHRQDDHLCVLLSGGLEYYWVAQNSSGTPLHEVKKVTIKPGDAWYTPNNCGHTMYFTADSVFLTLSRCAREPADYEADLVRIPSLRVAEPEAPKAEPNAALGSQYKTEPVTVEHERHHGVVERAFEKAVEKIHNKLSK